MMRHLLQVCPLLIARCARVGLVWQAFQLIREVCGDLFLGEYVVETASAKFAALRDARDKVWYCCHWHVIALSPLFSLHSLLCHLRRF